MKKYYILSLIFALSPLIIGLAIFIAWLNSHNNNLMTAGLLLLFLGFVIVLVGAGFVVHYAKLNKRENEKLAGKHKFRVRFAGILLSLSLVIAAICFWIAFDIETSYYMHIKNETSSQIVSCILIGPDLNEEIGPIDPDKSKIYKYKATADGQIDFVIHLNNETYNGVACGYVTRGLGDEIRINIKSDLKYGIKYRNDIDYHIWDLNPGSPPK